MPKVTMPQLGESVAEGTIGKWLKSVGEPVAKYEPIVEVITDKVNAEVPSPFEGTLTQILVEEGQTVPNNAEIAVIEAAGEAASRDAAAMTPSTETDGPPRVGPPAEAAEEPLTPAARSQEKVFATTPQAGDDERTVLGYGPAGSDERPARAPSGSPDPSAGVAVGAAAPTDSSATTARADTRDTTERSATASPSDYQGRMTPAVRRLAREHGVDLSLITGTGHDGRVTREDVLRFVSGGQVEAAPAAAGNGAAPAPPTAATGAASAQAVSPPPRLRGDELKPQTPMRKAIAAHMVRSKQSAPHAYTTVEVDMSGVVSLRESARAAYAAREGVNLSFVPFVTKAVVDALRRHPDLNAHWTDNGLLRKRDINVGIAVAVDDGLVVPVIRNADQLSINGLNRAVQDFAERARANRLRLDDIQGGTFTVNNTGWFGSVASQPIVNVPEIAILSMEAIVKRPVVIETPNGDTIGIRPIMNVCVSFDHRATDGAQIGRFVQDVRRWLESVDADTPIW